MNTKLMFKATVATFLIPGSVVVLIPYFVFLQSLVIDRFSFSLTAVVATIFASTGLTVLLHCIWGFALHGKGTLAPIDPPTVLVVRGLYKYTRNPMYLAVVIILLSEALFFNSLPLLVYALVVLFGFHIVVTVYEEPYLRSQFGKSYEEYVDTVPRWWISRTPFKSDSTS
jgi:protein-S-isoprenylcysteine O-methyltransferase Ste14